MSPTGAVLIAMGVVGATFAGLNIVRARLVEPCHAVLRQAFTDIEVEVVEGLAEQAGVTLNWKEVRRVR